MTAAGDGSAPPADELALIEADLPAFRVWRETGPTRLRYAAQARSLGTHPSAVVARDLTELRALLQAGPDADS